MLLLTKQRLRGANLVLALLTSVGVHVSAQAAGDLMFLKNSPATKFTQADFQMLSKSIDQALAGPADGPAQTWKNDTTGASGTVTPQSGQDSAGAQECRRLKIANSYKMMKDEGIYTFCRTGSKGKWKLRP
ncbi:RT0821/Lpp0805 family surface protein [Variovorax dokdonensis]|uniref:RT0821/Lpp0805 family surface protein n=1 Tax=Variovorax dokdonensis TaxID=344883 RepID=A0ABT7NEV6_9BURK|nr:RT0821/Lpp0805 family surface protein [Variovorax dokdonensis]MDM0046467.1 RT0821/Lpp0805 family surface protein [Variovorax dokdonensis]